MRLSPGMLTSTCQVLAQVKGPPDRLGQSVTTWQPQGQPVPCAAFPASERTLRRAGLLGVKVSKEVYLNGIDLNPARHRLVVDGVTYTVTDVQEWDGYTLAMVVSV
ncbi:hypothetical protein DEIPH_ctg041orf0007 [Deinococcus phoenicis]|uniref:Phage head-tail adaptor n=1 Tax=Deinococcus phoenicis TaxID=1476583 RepID=A0A016QN37_9DEIO|nr:hypothetical protein [Deinococcus phoenicis]EYB67411.1 hypothetical protein DEIPH_ctg041orf0007 [Deinococcus phoenicis]